MPAEVKLPIKINAMVHTECWTYYKLAIMEAFPSGKAWISSHMSAFVDSFGKLWFGDSDNPILGMRYFSDILTFKKRDFEGTSSSAIVQKMIKLINDNEYVILYILAPPEYKKPHEFFLYGYDMQKKFFYTTILGKSGHFEEQMITFNQIEKGFSDIKKWYSSDKNKINAFTFWFFPFTSIAVNPFYNPDWTRFEAMQKIIRETNGKGYVELDEFQENEGYSSHNKYFGLSCIWGMRNHVISIIDSRPYITDEDFFQSISHNLTKSMRKLFEYMTLICYSMKYLCFSADTAVSKVDKYIEEFESYINTVRIVYFNALRFEISRDWEILQTIRRKLEPLYIMAKKCLQNFSNVEKYSIF